MADLTDKEITEACARAWVDGCENRGWYTTAPGTTFITVFGETEVVYKPLTDRAQAMELVEKLLADGIGFYVSPHHAAFCWQETGFEIFRLRDDMTKIANLLRAICLCAALVQIEKEKNA